MSEVMKVEHYYYVETFSSPWNISEKTVKVNLCIYIVQTIESMFYHLDYFIEGEAEF